MLRCQNWNCFFTFAYNQYEKRNCIIWNQTFFVKNGHWLKVFACIEYLLYLLQYWAWFLICQNQPSEATPPPFSFWIENFYLCIQLNLLNLQCFLNASLHIENPTANDFRFDQSAPPWIYLRVVIMKMLPYTLVCISSPQIILVL